MMYRTQKKSGWESRKYIWDTDIVGFGEGVMSGEVGKVEGLECHFRF